MQRLKTVFPQGGVLVGMFPITAANGKWYVSFKGHHLRAFHSRVEAKKYRMAVAEFYHLVKYEDRSLIR